MTRAVVVQPLRRYLGEGGALVKVPLAVGVLRWFDPERTLTVMVKLTYSFAGEEVVLADEQQTVSLDHFSVLAGTEGEVRYATDFAPFKPQRDVLLAGHAYSPDGTPVDRIDAMVRVDDVKRDFTVHPSVMAERAPIGKRYVRAPLGEPTGVAGPRHKAALTTESHHDEDFDYSHYNTAVEAQRGALTDEPPRTVELIGLSPKGKRSFELPPLVPLVLVDQRGDPDEMQMQMHADTVWIETDAEQCVVVWRGQLELRHEGALRKVVVALEHPDVAWLWGDILADAPLGTFGMAAEPHALGPEPLDEDEKSALDMVRYEMMLRDIAPEPTLPLEQYAAISAELAEQRKPRNEVLQAHGFDEDRWMVEERAWMEKMADSAMAGDGTLAARFGELFMIAQSQLASPEEEQTTMQEYAEMVVAMERAEEPHKMLEERGFTLARWLRLDRRYQQQATQSDEARRELVVLLARERARGEAS